MENFEDDIRKGKLVRRVQEIWSITKNIIAYSLILSISFFEIHYIKVDFGHFEG